MWRAARFPLSRTSRRRFSAALALLAYLAVTLGLPLPIHCAGARGQPGSCQNQCCACGATADGRSRCCCSLPEEPSNRTDINAKPAPSSCCSQHKASDNSSPATPSCCAHATTTEKSPAKAPSASAWVLGITAFRCHGLSDLWFGAIVESLPPPLWSWCLSPPARPALRPADVFGDSFSSFPLDPPPRPTSI
jgi:hypothetical protein